MRDYKFRGKRIVNGEWVYGDYLRRWVGRKYKHYIHDMAWGEYVVDPKTIGQFTGLCDKRGTQIFEGDILRQEFCTTVRDEDYIGHHIGIVVILPSKGVCMRSPLCYLEDGDGPTISRQYKPAASYRCEVIGNIYEYPHLLKEDTPCST